MNNAMDASPEDNSNGKACSEGVRPKVKHHLCKKGTKPGKASQIGNGIQNGSASQSEKISSIQNGASCSSSTSSSSSLSPSSSYVNKMLSDKTSVDLSGEKCSAKGRTLSSEDMDLRNHDKKRKTGSFLNNDSSSGSEGDEGLSGDECCIYTYKGDQFADLPNSFFTVDMVVNEKDHPPRVNRRERHHRRESQSDENKSHPGSSPEMDYLEMDFDPDPSLEQDSEEDIGFGRKAENESPVPDLPSELMVVDDHVDSNFSTRMEMCQDSQEPQPGPSNENFNQCSSKKHSRDRNSNNFNGTKDFLDNCAGFCSPGGSNQTSSFTKGGREETTIETGANDVNAFSCQLFAGKRLDKNSLSTEKNDMCVCKASECEKDSKTPFDGIMLWTEQEAIAHQVSLVTPEVSCCMTAVVNVMLVLKRRFSHEKIREKMLSLLKAENSSIPQFLVSRSFAGMAHQNLIRSIHHASYGNLYARFFQMNPRRDVVLSRWLCHWMKKGAVPVATMNVERDAAPENPSPDTRHHQMIFGVNSKGIYLTNPLECLQDDELWSRMVSPTVLKIKRSEIVSRWSPETNLKPLMFQRDDRWKKMNVLGQVVNIIRESPDAGAQGKFLTQEIGIPASSGITLVISRDSSGYSELVSTPELPILTPSKSE